MPSQQNFAFQNTFGDSLAPDELNFSTNTKKNSNGSDMREIENVYTGIYTEWLISVLINMFSYTGLPESVNWHYLEYLLRTQAGYAGIGLNSSGDLVVYDQIAQPQFNQYGDYAATPGNGVWQKLLGKVSGNRPRQIFPQDPRNGDYAVFVNKYSYSQYVNRDLYTVGVYAKELANIRALMHYNLQFQKTPVVFMGPKGSLDPDNIWSRVIGGETLIKVSQSYDISQIDTIDLHVPLIQAELKDAWNGVLSEFLTQYGINTVGVDKKERVLKSEAEANNQVTMASLNAFLEPRRMGIELLNQRFGKQAEVHLNTNAVDTIAKAMMLNTDNQPQASSTDGDTVNDDVKQSTQEGGQANG